MTAELLAIVTLIAVFRHTSDTEVNRDQPVSSSYGRETGGAEMQLTDAVTVVQEMVDAYNARDLDGTLAYYAPDAVIVDNEGTVLGEGREAIHHVFAQVFAANPHLHAEVPSVVRVGDWVAIHSIVRDWEMRDGSRQEMQWIELYRVVEGKIRRVHLFH